MFTSFPFGLFGTSVWKCNWVLCIDLYPTRLCTSFVSSNSWMCLQACLGMESWELLHIKSCRGCLDLVLLIPFKFKYFIYISCLNALSGNCITESCGLVAKVYIPVLIAISRKSLQTLTNKYDSSDGSYTYDFIIWVCFHLFLFSWSFSPMKNAEFDCLMPFEWNEIVTSFSPSSF